MNTMKNKIGLVIGFLFVLLVVVSVYNISKKNSLANENVDLKSEIASLETEQQETANSQTDNTSENEEDSGDNNNDSDNAEEENTSDDTFEEDIEWFLKNLYTDKSKKSSYETLKDSATEDLLKSQFGNELPPEDETDGEKGIDNDIKNVEVYGKYSNDTTYKALVDFEIISTYEDKEDSGNKIVEFTIKEEDDKWLVDNIEDKAK